MALARWLSGSILGFALSAATAEALPVANPQVVMQTTLGAITLELYPDVAPITVANFLGYASRGDYDHSYIHRSLPGLIIQGGSLAFLNDTSVPVPKQAPIVNEFSRTNAEGSIAMAKLPGDPNSATNGWFFNLANNGPDRNGVEGLDTQNGGFTVFGKVIAGMDVVRAIAAVPRYNAGGELSSLPLRNFNPQAPNPDLNQHLIFVNSVQVVPEPGTLTLLGTGLALIAAHRRARNA